MWTGGIYITKIGSKGLKNPILIFYQISTKELCRNFCTKSSVQSEVKTNLLDKVSEKQKHPIINKTISELRSLVEDLFYMSEVRESQLKVMTIKDELQKSGDRKREILFELNKIRNDLQKCHTETCNTVRGTQRYVDLVKEEMNLLQMEKKTQTELNKVDSLERQSFNNLSYAINDTHEKEKIHSNTLKMWGLIGTLIGSSVSLIISTFGFYFHNTKIDRLIKNIKVDINENFKLELGKLKSDFLVEIRNNIKKNNKAIEEIQRRFPDNKSTYKEGWGSYFKRHSLSVYRYFCPRTK